MKKSFHRSLILKENLNKNGFAIDKNFYDLELIKEIQKKFNLVFNKTYLSKTNEPGLLVNKKLVKYLNFPLVISEESFELLLNKDVLDIASDYLKADVKLSYIVAYRTLTVSPALRNYYNTPGVFSGWHSDNQFEVHGHRMLTVMTYLTDVTVDNGPLEIAEKTFDLNKKKRIFFEEELEDFNRKEITGQTGTTIFFDMDSVHKANIPKKGFRDVIRFSYSPKNGYSEKLYFLSEKLEKKLDNFSKQIIDFENNKNHYKYYSKPNNIKIRNFLHFFKEKIIFLLCHFELFSKWYLKRRIKILKSKII